MTPPVSNETLHAFIDGELDLVESEMLIARMRDDAELTQRVCSLRSLHAMVQLAYVEPPVSAGRAASVAPRRLLMRRCAFGCLVVLAGLGGWALRGQDSPDAMAMQPAGPLAGYDAVSLVAKADRNRIMLHLDSGAPVRMQAVLDRAESLLDDAEQQGRAMQLEILVNSHGIRLLRAGHSPYEKRIADMRRRHANLNWVVCGQSIARFTSEGQKIELLPATRTAPTAIGEIVTRLQQGWTYVRV